MPAVTREQVFQALFALLTPLVPGTFVTASRVVGPAMSFPTANQPAIMLWEHDERTDQAGIGTPRRRTWTCRIAIYARVTRTEVIGPGVITANAGAAVINPLIEAVETALAPSPVDQRQSLGGLVVQAWIEGEITKETGDLDSDGQAIAVIPVKILVP